MRIELVVGRGNNREVFEVSEGTDPDTIATALLRLSRPYLLSTTIDATWNPETKTGIVYVGGWRTVGHAKVID